MVTVGSTELQSSHSAYEKGRGLLVNFKSRTFVLVLTSGELLMSIGMKFGAELKTFSLNGCVNSC